MQYETKYRILKTDGSVIEGQYIQTKGNDEDYPTFVLADGSRLGVHKDAVLGPVTDDCPVDGITRPHPMELWNGHSDFGDPHDEIDRIDCDILDAEAEEERYRGLVSEG